MREQYGGREIFTSSDARHGAAVIIGDFLALGARERLTQLIDSRESGRSFKDSPQLAAADKTRRPAMAPEVQPHSFPSAAHKVIAAITIAVSTTPIVSIGNCSLLGPLAGR